LEVLDIGLPKVREFESGNCRGRDKTVWFASITRMCYLNPFALDIPSQEYNSIWRAVVEVLEGSLLSQRYVTPSGDMVGLQGTVH
jgi:hypothetical protein